MNPEVGAQILAGKPNRRFAEGFAKYVRWLLSRDFHAVRIARGTGEVLAALNDFDGPVIVLLSHASWWDPLVSIHLAERFCRARSGCAPMEIAQLRKFGFFRRLGLFGIDPEAPSAAALMRSYVSGVFARERKPTLWITPQGRFADARDEAEIRPGAAAIASGHPGCRVVSVAIEYGFWLDRRAEVFVRVAPCEAVGHGGHGGRGGRGGHVGHGSRRDEPPRSTAAWQRGMVESMRRNAAELATLVISRDPGAFETLLGGETRINPFMDVWLRLRGQSRSLDSARLRAQGGRPDPAGRP